MSKTTTKINESQYLQQYLNEWQESTSDLFVGDIMTNFLKFKAGQFNLESYKKQINRNLKKTKINSK